jgi:hypothetical protein
VALPFFAVGPPPKFNVLDAVVDLPTGLRLALSDAELDYIWDAFHLGLPAYLLMRFVRHQPFVKEALVDHEVCVNTLLQRGAALGTARWSALQAAEKMMKSVLATLGEKVPHTHDLSVIAKRLFDAGLEPVNPTDIATIQCAPAVRYGASPVTLEEAVRAHHASLAVSGHVAVAIRSVMPGPDGSWTGG